MDYLIDLTYDPRKHPCYQCKNRHATCHGTCELYKKFEATRPKRKRRYAY